MELINRTPLCAALHVGPGESAEQRRARVLAKASYRWDDTGALTPDAEAPHPIYVDDQPTPLGLLPRDDLPRPAGIFELLLLGQAHAPAGEPTEQMTVALELGRERREMTVFGDRVWQGEGAEARISAAEPFLTMPLTPERAFGGTVVVEVDEGSEVEVSHPQNPGGRGFDPAEQVAQIAELLRPPEGFPRHDPLRRLPNLEDPEQRVQGWDDAPEPLCWAPWPLFSGPQGVRAAARLLAGGGEELLADPRRLAALLGSEMFLRAHPCWLMHRPAAGAWLLLEGLTPGMARGERLALALALPELRVLGDLQCGETARTLELEPQTLVVLPEERGLYLVYRAEFCFPFASGERRGLRLRTCAGWYGDPLDDPVSPPNPAERTAAAEPQRS